MQVKKLNGYFAEDDLSNSFIGAIPETTHFVSKKKPTVVHTVHRVAVRQRL